MAMLILDENGRSFKVPECEKCDSKMLPLELDHIEKNMWKCPYCMNEKKYETDYKGK